MTWKWVDNTCVQRVFASIGVDCTNFGRGRESERNWGGKRWEQKHKTGVRTVPTLHYGIKERRFASVWDIQVTIITEIRFASEDSAYAHHNYE